MNMSSQLGKKWARQPPSANYKQDVWEFLLAPISPTWHHKLQKARRLAATATNRLMSAVQGNTHTNDQL